MSSDASQSETTPRRTQRWIIAFCVVLAFALVGVAWAIGSGRSRNDAGDAPAGSGPSDETTQAVEATGTLETTPTAVVEPEGGNSDPEYDPNADPALVEQHLGIITDVIKSGGSYAVTIDYVQFVVGEEANKAAEAHGDAVPGGGIYVVNDNPLTRTRPVAPDIMVHVAVDDAGMPNEAGQTVPLAEWATGFDGSQSSAFRSGTYVLTLTNGTVTMLEQLFVP